VNAAVCDYFCTLPVFNDSSCSNYPRNEEREKRKKRRRRRRLKKLYDGGEGTAPAAYSSP
jgi:hypothetical protein